MSIYDKMIAGVSGVSENGALVNDENLVTV
jgi:hypothetical protein